MFEGWNNPEHLKQIAEDILTEAQQKGATSAEVDIAVNKGYSVASRKGEVESVEYHRDKIVDVTVYIGQRSGSASFSDLRPVSIHAAVQAACNLAAFGDEDTCAGLADKNLLAFNYPDILNYYPWDISVERAIELTLECERYALETDKRITMAENINFVTSEAFHVYGNSHGFLGAFPSTRHEISCVLIAQNADDMQRDYYYTTSCDPQLLESVKQVATKAADRSVARLDGRSLSTRKVPVIFAAEEARSLLGLFVNAISGGSLYRKSSFLLDHLGKPVFPKHINISEKPHLDKALGSAPFDADGVITRPNVFIDQGILTSYALGVYSARKLGMESTGNAGGVHNLHVNFGDKDLQQLMKKMGTGLLVTELMGQGVNLVTGNYSRGASGYWIENGEILFPVHEVTIAGNLREMFANIVEIGGDVDKRGNIQTGSILIESMTVAGE